MDAAKQYGASSLFLVRMWVEETQEGAQWHGKLQHVVSGESREFTDWSALVEGMNSMLPQDAGIITEQKPETTAAPFEHDWRPQPFLKFLSQKQTAGTSGL